MSPEGTKRKLTAILSADVKGYSRLMEDDEEATVATLSTYRQVIAGVVKKHEGRVVDSPGDNVLAEFTSVVEAMRGAVEIQEELRARNSELPDHRRMEFRIGINLGDVIEEEGRIYGDGVNIAARVESLADAGGICLSESAYQQVKNKLSLGIEFLGQHEVKNISEPVPVYRLVMEPGAVKATVSPAKKAPPSSWKKWAMPAIPAVIVAIVGVALWQFYLRPKPPVVEPASVERMAFPLPEKPSIAVLPFVNMSGDPEQEYIADGISESIIAYLSKISEMFVIARNSTFSYKGKSPKVQQVAEELGVKHVLEGSVQRSGDRIRVTAQLIDALTGHHLWSEIYERQMEDLFDLMDGITKEVVVALQVELTVGEQARLQQETDNLEAWGYAVRAYDLYNRSNKEDMAKARELYKKAAALDPEYVSAWYGLAATHWVEATFGWSESRTESFKRSTELTEKALALDATHPEANGAMGMIHLSRREYAEAVAWGEKAIALGPNNAEVHALLGMIKDYVGQPEETIEVIKKAIRLHPQYPAWYLYWLGTAYRNAGRYEEAIDVSKQYLGKHPLGAHSNLAACYSLLGRMDKARTHVEEGLKLDPKWSLEGVAKYYKNSHFYKDSNVLRVVTDALRNAGLPEKPPLPLPDKPSIAVLPFANISGDPEQEYFADGMTDDLIMDLSKISGLFVIARNSVFSYKGKSPKVQDVGRDMGVRYVLEGSVRRAGDQVRINAQLIDAKTGGHLWAERYDGNMTDIFALQDKINQKIVAAMAVELTRDEQRGKGSETKNVLAYEAFLKGRHHFLRHTPEDLAKAARYFKAAVELDPDYGEAYAGLANTFWMADNWNWSGSLGVESWEAKLLGRAYVETAMNTPTSLAYQMAARLSLELRLHERAVSEAERAIALDPNDPEAHLVMGNVLNYAGRPQDAVAFLETSMRLDPLNVARARLRLGQAQFCMGQYETAVASLERSLADNPDLGWPKMLLASAYAHLGRDREAQETLQSYFGRSGSAPDLRIAAYFPFKDPHVLDRFAKGLHKAGMSGDPYGYPKILEENRLTGSEIRDLVFGKTIEAINVWQRGWRRIKRTKDGKSVTWDGRVDGKSWIEGDTLCSQWPERFGGHKMCATVFRNPGGTSEGRDQYFMISDLEDPEVFFLKK